MNIIERCSSSLRRAVLTVLSTGLTVAIVVAPAFGRLHNQIRVTIPFDFSAGKNMLSAGKYTVDDLANGALAVRAIEGGDHAVVLARIEIEPAEGGGTPTLVFNRYGDQAFLSEVRTGWDQSVYKVPTSSSEERLARAGTAPHDVLLIKADAD